MSHRHGHPTRAVGPDHHRHAPGGRSQALAPEPVLGATCGHPSPGGGLTCALPPHTTGGHVWQHTSRANHFEPNTEGPL